MDRGRIPPRGKQRGVRRGIIRHLPSSHTVRRAARTRPGIHHICRLTGSDKKAFDRHQRPGQGLARAIIRWSESIARRGNKLRLQWISGQGKSRATRLLTGWPRQQQQASAVAIANLSDSCHGQACPTLRGRQPRPSREERRSGLNSELSNGGRTSPHETRVPQGTEEQEKGSCVKVLPVADWACPDRPFLKDKLKKPDSTNAGGARLVNDKPEITSSRSVGGGRLKSMCYGHP